jgi:hypothetical protein
MSVDRFAGAVNSGLLGSILGKDMSGGIAGMLVGSNYPSLTNIQNTGMSTFGLTPELEKAFGAEKAFGHFGMMGGPTPNA